MEKMLGLPLNLWANVVLGYLDIESFLKLRAVSRYCNSKSLAVLSLYAPALQQRISTLQSMPLYVSGSEQYRAALSAAADTLAAISAPSYNEIRTLRKPADSLVECYTAMVVVLTGKVSTNPSSDLFAFSLPAMNERVRNMTKFPDLAYVEGFLGKYTKRDMERLSLISANMYQVCEEVVKAAAARTSEFRVIEKQLATAQKEDRIISKLQTRVKG